MGMKMIIKGADFSENGFTYEVVEKVITTLKKADGTEFTLPQELEKSEGVYFYEDTGKTLKNGSNLANAASTSKFNETENFIDVEDYTDATITSANNVTPAGVVAGAAILFFLDSDKNLIGGISNAKVGSDTLTEAVGQSAQLRTFTRKIPANCRYIVCTHNPTILEGFKLVLRKYAKK